MKVSVFMRGCFVALFSVVLGSGAFAGSWFDDFESYADQAAFDAHPQWGGADGKAEGRLSAGTGIMGGKSLLCQQTVVETRPRHSLHEGGGDPSAGRVDLWVYDDGSDIKSFDVIVANGANSIALGLRDTTVGSDTNYTFNGVATSVARSTGWHLLQFAVHGTNGATAQIDRQSVGSAVAALVAADHLTIDTTLGAGTDANQVWIDSVHWKFGTANAVLPARAPVVVLDDFDGGIANWNGTPNMFKAYITDDYSERDDGAEEDYARSCMDMNADTAGPRTASATFVSVVPWDGHYSVGFDYMNNPTWAAGYSGSWPNLTVAVTDGGSVNLGSDRSSGFIYGETSTFHFGAGSGVTITISGDDELTPPASNTEKEFVRFDSIYLMFDSLQALPPARVADWTQY